MKFFEITIFIITPVALAPRIHSLRQVIKAVVEASRENLVIGQP